MTNFTAPNYTSSMIYALKSVPGLADVGVLPNFAMPNNTSSMIYTLKSVPGLADVRVLHGVGDGLRAPPRCQGGPEKISND